MKFENVEEGVTVAKQIDEVTGLSTLVVIDPKRRAGAAAKGVRPQVKLLDDSGEEIKIAGSDLSVNITFQLGSIITVKDGQQVAVGEVLARIPQETSKTRDITGGLPRVAELFEARSPKDAGMLAEVTGTVSFGKDTKGKQRLVITDLDGVAHEYLIPKDKHVTAHDGQVVNKGESIVDGPADPHDILRLLGVEALARYITDEVQDVYRLQGVKINDKHIEVIVRQMLRRVQVAGCGRHPLHLGRAGRALGRAGRERQGRSKDEGKKPATYEHMLLGITKASLSTDSFISAASFQETTRVLTEAAIMGKKDDLRGLKENVIVGRLIPAGTGLAYHNARKRQKLLGPRPGSRSRRGSGGGGGGSADRRGVGRRGLTLSGNAERGRQATAGLFFMLRGWRRQRLRAARFCGRVATLALGRRCDCGATGAAAGAFKPPGVPARRVSIAPGGVPDRRARRLAPADGGQAPARSGTAAPDRARARRIARESWPCSPTGRFANAGLPRIPGRRDGCRRTAARLAPRWARPCDRRRPCRSAACC